MRAVAAPLLALAVLLPAACLAASLPQEGVSRPCCGGATAQQQAEANATDGSPDVQPPPPGAQLVASAGSAVAAGSPHPMAPYLALRPVLPAKPTFMPPFVDPNLFVDKKAALLGNLFGASPPGYAYYAPAPAPFGPAPAAYGPAPAPVGFAPPPFFAAPNVFAAKKTSFLSSLFNSLQQPPPQVPAPQARRAVVGPGAAPTGPGVAAPGVFAAKKAAFLQKLFETLNSTAAPDTSEPLPSVPLAPVDPAAFASKKTEFLNALFDSLGLPPPTPAAPAVPAGFWSPYFPPADVAAAAPTPKPTIVPAGFWSPFSAAPADAPPNPFAKPTLFPPGFWAPPWKPTPPPSPYKQKVAFFLDKLFKSLNTTAAPDVQASAARRSVDTSVEEVEDGDKQDIKTDDGESKVARRFIGPPFASPVDGPAKPFGGPFGLKPFGPGGPFGAGGPFGKPFMGGPFAKPFAGPPFAKPFAGGPFAKPFAGGPFAGGPFAGGAGGPFAGAKPFSPFAPAPVDPQVFVDKKTTFLTQLFASKAAASAAPPAEDAAASEDDFWAQFGVPTAKPTIVSPGFWSPFGASGSVAAAPTAKPTIVPPGFWSPFGAAGAAPTSKPTIVPPGFWSPFKPAAAPAAPAAPADALLDKKAKFLQTLFATLNTTPAPQPEEPETTDDADPEFDAFLEDLAMALAAPAPAKRSLGAAAASPEAARQQLLDSVVTQLATLKDDMVGTVDEILKQKASAAAQSPFPFAKSPYAAYGAAKKGPMGGGPPAGKKAGPPFWAGAAPTADPTAPLQQRLKMLSQAFDSLTAIQKDAAAAVQAAADASSAQAAQAAQAPGPVPDTATLLQLLRAAAPPPPLTKAARVKAAKKAPSLARSLQFAVRQGALSLPAGAEELLTAGGGANSAPDDAHEGGGLRLQAQQDAGGDDADEGEEEEEEEEEESPRQRQRGRHHHHNHQSHRNRQ